MFYIVFAAVSVALLAALYNYIKVKKRDAGTKEMKQIAAAIQEGASAFIWHEYKIIIIVSIIVADHLCRTYRVVCGSSVCAGCVDECDSRLCWDEDCNYCERPRFQ